MARKSFLGLFKNKLKTLEFSHRSLILNVDLTQANLFSFSLFQHGSEVASGQSRVGPSARLQADIKVFVDRLAAASDPPNLNEITNIQSELSRFTDDLLPRTVRDFLVNNAADYKYLVVEDSGLSVSIPYGILFLPVNKPRNTISEYGFFISEFFTVVRAEYSETSLLNLTSVATLSSEDLSGSIREEQDLHTFFNGKRPNTAVALRGSSDLVRVLKDINPSCLHFCCHGTNDNRIASKKSGNWEVIEMDLFNLHRFPDNSLIFLNICLSSYTVYQDGVARSIANKFIDRNAHLVIATEWPISDRFAFVMGTNFYSSILTSETVLSSVHQIKQTATTIEDRLTALTYTLRGNPNLRVRLEA